MAITVEAPIERPWWAAAAERWRWIWAAAIVGIAVHAVVFPHTHTLFDLYTFATRRWWVGLPIYPEPLTSLFIFRYSPLFAVAITPIAWLPERLGSATWKTANALTYVIGLRLWVRAAAPRQLNEASTGLFFLLVLATSLINLHDGQANLMMVSLTLTAIVALLSGRRWIAGALVAMATLIKAYPLALALLLAAVSAPFLFFFIAALAGGLLLPVALQQPAYAVAQTLTWFRLLAETSGVRQVSSQSIDLLWTMAGRSLSTAAYNTMSAAAGLGALAVRVRMRGMANRRAMLFEVYALFALWVALFGPTSEPSTYVVLAPVAAWCAIDAFERRQPWPWRVALVASLVMLGPFVTTMFGARVQQWAQQHGCLPIGAIVLGAYIVAHHGGRLRS